MRPGNGWSLRRMMSGDAWSVTCTTVRQQQLVAATLGLRAVADQVPPEVAPLVEAIREQVTQTIGTLRELARGVFPPILADAGPADGAAYAAGQGRATGAIRGPLA